VSTAENGAFFIEITQHDDFSNISKEKNNGRW